LKIVHIIENDAAVLSSLQALMLVEGFDARAYHSALDFIVSLTPDVSGCVVTYADMPKITGVDLLTEMAERRLCLPIIVTSGVAAAPLLERATRLGAMVVKPFDPDDLVTVVRKALCEPEESDAGGATIIGMKAT
jgi:two-component system response regulator FixJ